MITIKNLSKKYDTFNLRSIDLEIHKNEYLVILGPSGAGKTVILELLAGLEKPDGGSIEGLDDKKIGFIYQDYMLFPHLNVFKNIAYGLKIRKYAKDKIIEKVNEAAQKLDISHLLKRDVTTLSGGECQRVAIARALVIKPSVFLLDEPTSALDSNRKNEIQKIFTEIHKELDSCFIHVTHDFEEALMMADRIAVLEDGKIVQLDKPENIFNKPVNSFVANFVGYQNVYKGYIKDNNFYADGLKLYTSAKESENCYIAIKSSNIIIAKEKVSSSARNCFPGKIVEIIKKVAAITLKIDIGVIISADITYKSLEEMQLKEDDSVYTVFKTSSILVFEH